MRDNGDGKTYLSEVPQRIPEGQILVDNWVWPREQLNANGFRVWLQAPANYLEPCFCGWASEIGQHYKPRR